MNRPRTSGSGRRFELVLIRLRPPTPRTVGLIAKHASAESYHWMLVLGRADADRATLARLLAVAYLDEASGLLGRGDPRWAVPRAYLRADGTLERDAPDGPSDRSLPPFVRRELDRIARWLRGRRASYLADLEAAFRRGPPDDRFRRLAGLDVRRRGFFDPTGRGMLAPDPPPLVTRTGPDGSASEAVERLPWRRFVARRG